MSIQKRRVLLMLNIITLIIFVFWLLYILTHPLPLSGRTSSEIPESCDSYSLSTPEGASASSILNEDGFVYDAVYAIDGDTGTYWKSAEPYPQWIAFSLGELRCINAIEVFVDAASVPVTMDIQVSDDGDSWQTVVSGWQVIESSYVRKDFNEAVGGYVRVLQTSGAGTESTLTEIKVSSGYYNFSNGAIIDFCADSDGGKRYGIRGAVNASTISVSSIDTCVNAAVLEENYCSDVNPMKEIYTCPSGNACRDGACIAISTDTSNGEENNLPLVPLTKPLNVLLQVGEQVNFVLDGKRYSVGILGITEKSASIIIPGTSFSVTMDTGESRSFDITNDGNDDIKLKINYINISSKEVNITLETLSRVYLLEHRQCFIYPPTCPSNGKQARICVDRSNPALGATKEDILCTPGICEGCLRESICLPYGTRFRDYHGDGTDKYCGDDGLFHEQKDSFFLSPSGESAISACSFDYECLSNNCESNKCVGVQEIISEAPKRQSTVVQLLCKAANALDEREYESCLLQFLTP